jgi:hypothetical protein
VVRLEVAAGVLRVGGVGVRGGGEGAAVEGGDEAEGAVEGGHQVRDEALEGADEGELRVAAEGDGLLHAPALLPHGREIVAAAGSCVGLGPHCFALWSTAARRGWRFWMELAANCDSGLQSHAQTRLPGRYRSRKIKGGQAG